MVINLHFKSRSKKLQAGQHSNPKWFFIKVFPFLSQVFWVRLSLISWDFSCSKPNFNSWMFSLRWNQTCFNKTIGFLANAWSNSNKLDQSWSNLRFGNIFIEFIVLILINVNRPVWTLINPLLNWIKVGWNLSKLVLWHLECFSLLTNLSSFSEMDLMSYFIHLDFGLQEILMGFML